MIKFFEKGYEGYLPNKTFPDKDNILKILSKELGDFKKYMWNSGIRVNSEDSLLKLLLNVTPELELQYVDFTTTLHSNINSGKDVFGLITTSSKGKVFKNNFYRYHSSDMFMLLKSDLELLEKVDWRTLKPISVLSTTNYHINFYTNKMKDIEPDSKFTVFGLKLFDLVVMYRGWALDRQSLGLSIYPDLFIGSIIYPMVWETMLDMTIINRFDKLIKEEDMIPSKQALPYPIKSIESRLDKYLLKVIEYSKSKKFTIPEIFNFIPLTSDLKDFYRFKLLLGTNNKWVVWYGRASILNSLLMVIEESDAVSKNSNYLGRLSFDIRRFYNQSISGPRDLPLFYQLDIEDEFDSLKEKIKKLKL